MVKGVLVDRLIDAGGQLVQKLDEAGLDVKAALWLYQPEPNSWVLVLGLPEVETSGPRAVYQKIRSVIKSNQPTLDVLDLEDIVVADTNDVLVREFRDGLQTGRSIGKQRITDSRVHNTFVEDALVYRAE